MSSASDVHTAVASGWAAASATDASTTSLVRVTTSYRVLELGLSEVWLGIITAAFAILPMSL